MPTIKHTFVIDQRFMSAAEKLRKVEVKFEAFIHRGELVVSIDTIAMTPLQLEIIGRRVMMESFTRWLHAQVKEVAKQHFPNPEPNGQVEPGMRGILNSTVFR